MQKADRAGDGVEFVAGKTFRDVGEVERRLLKHSSNLFSELADGLGRRFFGLAVGLAAEIVRYLGRVGVSVGDALVAFFRDAFRDRGVDADLGGGRNDAMRRRRQRWIERLAAG